MATGVVVLAAEPAARARGQSAAVLAALVVLAVVGLVFLMKSRKGVHLG